MKKLQELLDFLSGPTYESSYAIAKATGTCLMCGNPAKVFRDMSAKIEYDVSALCQKCQDEFFKGR